MASFNFNRAPEIVSGLPADFNPAKYAERTTALALATNIAKGSVAPESLTQSQKDLLSTHSDVVTPEKITAYAQHQEQVAPIVAKATERGTAYLASKKSKLGTWLLVGGAAIAAYMVLK